MVNGNGNLPFSRDKGDMFEQKQAKGTKGEVLLTRGSVQRERARVALALLSSRASVRESSHWFPE